MRRLAALLWFITAPLWAQNPNQLPPCPPPDTSKTQEIGWSGRTWHWNDCWGRYTFQLREETRGDVIEGEWRYGKLSGQGIHTSARGDRYVGEFRNFRKHGRGQMNYANGDRYEGDFSNNQLHGQGTYRYANGDVYAGEFAAGEFHGQGTYTHADGARYVGEYRHDKRHGIGTFVAANGDKYVGEYEDGLRSGQGSYVFATGEKYFGEFRQGQFHGQGAFITADGQRYEGRWEDGEPTGAADSDTPEETAEQALQREREELAEERRLLDEERRLFEQEREQNDAAPPASDEDDDRYVAGSGFVITADGYIVTNYHVVEGTSELTVRTTRGQTYPASIIKVDTKNDLALLKIAAAGLAYVPLTDSSTVKKGTTVLAAGFPQIVVQGIEPKITDGIISSLTGIMDDVTAFQISNPIQPGNSGGPLFTLDGNVVGVVTAQLSEKAMLKRYDSIPQNVNFAVKSAYLLDLLKNVRALKLPPANPKRKFRTTEDVVGAVEPALVLIIGQ